MSLDSIVFINNFPSIDLHGYTRDFAIIAIKEFINDNVKMKNEFIVIVHGKGTGILKETCLNVLKKNKYVKDYKIWYLNDGCPVVQLNKSLFD